MTRCIQLTKNKIYTMYFFAIIVLNINNVFVLTTTTTTTNNNNINTNYINILKETIEEHDLISMFGGDYEEILNHLYNMTYETYNKNNHISKTNEVYDIKNNISEEEDSILLEVMDEKFSMEIDVRMKELLLLQDIQDFRLENIKEYILNLLTTENPDDSNNIHLINNIIKKYSLKSNLSLSNTSISIMSILYNKEIAKIHNTYLEYLNYLANKILLRNVFNSSKIYLEENISY